LFFAIESLTHANIFSSTLASHLHQQDWSPLAQMLVDRRLAAKHLALAAFAPAFDHAAVLGPIQPAAKTGHLAKGAISLAVNGAVRQNSDLDKMIWSVAEQIAKLSEAFELKAGDIIYSGTPENVGPVVKGDVLLCKIEGLPDMSIRIT